MYRKNGMATLSPDKKSTHNVARVLVLLTALFLAALVAVPYLTGQSAGAAKQQQQQEPTREDVLARLVEAGVVAAGEPTITRLTGVEELKKTRQVMYRNARDGQYEIKWPTLFVIYDYENDSVVNSLSITQVRLPE